MHRERISQLQAQGLPIPTESERLTAVEVITALSVLYTDRARLTADEAHAIADAVALLRTHALPDSHPWALG